MEEKWSFYSVEILPFSVDLFQNFFNESIPSIIFYMNSESRQLYYYYKYGLGLIFFILLFSVKKNNNNMQILRK